MQALKVIALLALLCAVGVYEADAQYYAYAGYPYYSSGYYGYAGYPYAGYAGSYYGYGYPYYSYYGKRSAGFGAATAENGANNKA